MNVLWRRARRCVHAYVAATIALFVAHTTLAAADDFYKGKTVTILVGSSAGGGYDAYARLLSRHLGRHIPGNPGVVVSNMPGAASLTSVIYLDKTAPKDGTFIDTFDPATISDARMGTSKLNLDFRQYAWLGSISQGTTGCYIWHALGIANLEDARAHAPLHFGLNAPGSPNDLNQRILRSVFGVKIETIAGYPGAGEQTLAIQRGELDGFCGAWTSVPAEWIESRKIIPLVRAGPLLPANMPSSVPYVVDIAPSQREATIIRFLLASGVISRPYIASAAVPKDRIALLTAAFDATMQDSAFLDDAAKQGLPVAATGADAAAKLVNDIYGASDDIVVEARKLVGE